MPFKQCDGCSKDLPLGATKYTVRIEITSDYDGFLPEFEVGAEEGALEAVLDQVEFMSADELEEDVHLEVEATLCRECRDRLVEQIHSSMDVGVNSRPKRPHILH